MFNTLRTRHGGIYGEETSWIEVNAIREMFDRSLWDLQAVARLLGLNLDLVEIVGAGFSFEGAGTIYTEEQLETKHRQKGLRPPLDACR